MAALIESSMKLAGNLASEGENFRTGSLMSLVPMHLRMEPEHLILLPIVGTFT